jgi:DNA mismatch endonuclease (patch repair protein)
MHGCFWHQHGCETYEQPLSREWFWSQKLANNVLRDAEVGCLLRRKGWRSLAVWECELRSNPANIAWKAIRFLG